MLNISENSINDHIRLEDFRSHDLLRKSKIKRLFLYLTLSFLFALILALFLPWTQNIMSKGYVTTRSPEQRPQAIQSVISGRLENWFVREGDFVNKGDTIVFISEVKSEYFDPELLLRIKEQVDAKSGSVGSYDGKIKALSSQYEALEASLDLAIKKTNNKILQTRNKITIDSIDLNAFRLNLQIAENQLSRTRELYDKGLKTRSELQEKELKLQESQAKVTVQENKLLNQRNEWLNLFIELDAVERSYSEKLNKTKSDMQSAISGKFESMGEVAKLQNLQSNYNQRQQFYYIKAPQSGYITKTITKGIGEVIKEGTDIATIMPATYDLAIEVYLLPRDLPLISLDNPVRIRFDGWPAIVISGWPESSTGVFDGNIIAIDRFTNTDGFYRVMISPDNKEKAWPEELRVGAGANAFILLKDVPVWYEIWRQLNGFPPDYYQQASVKSKDLKEKPLKFIK